MTSKYDVIIVGAGPSGSLAAKTLAERGLKILLLERALQPGDKSVGGEFLPISIFQRFPWMREGPVQRAINKWAFYFPYEDKLTEFKFSRKDEFGFTVHRPEWDNWVSKFAVEAGAHLKSSTLVDDLIVDRTGFVKGIITEEGEKFHSTVVIGADGSNSTVAKKAGLRRGCSTKSFALCVKYTFTLPEKEITKMFTDGENTEIEIFYSERISPLGFGWVFPSKKDFCVGVGSAMDRVDNNMHPYLNNLLNLPILKEKMRKAELSECSSHTTPVQGPEDNVYCKGLMLVGDAAGLVCPFDGAGYEAAVYSGTLAAEIAEKAVTSRDCSEETLREYEKKLKNSWVGGDLRLGSKFQNFIADIVGIDNFSRILYDMAATVTKHGSYKDKSHRDTLMDFMDKHSQLLKEAFFHLIPVLTPFLGNEDADTPLKQNRS